MSCPDCTTSTGFPNTCGQVVVVNYRPPEASSAIPAWLEYNCDGETPELILYSTPELDETIDDWDIDYIELIGKGISGTSCADPVHADLCPPTLEAIHDMFVEQTTAINANIDEEIQAQTASINANIDEAETAIVNAIGAAADDVENAISGQTAALESALGDVEDAIAAASSNQISAIETAGDDIEAAISGQTTAINNNIDAAEVAIVNAVASNAQVLRVGIPGAAKQIAVSAVSNSVALTPGVRHASLYAVNGAIRYNINAAADGTSHYLGYEERVDIQFTADTTIHAIQANGSSATSLEITELS